MTAVSFLARIQMALGKLSDVEPPTHPADNGSNTAPLLAQLFLWKTVQKHAEAKYDAALKELKSAVDVPTEPGHGTLCESHGFEATVTISEPVRRFNADALATALNKSKYRVPLADAKKMIEAAKLETSSTTTIKIVERI